MFSFLSNTKLRASTHLCLSSSPAYILHHTPRQDARCPYKCCRQTCQLLDELLVLAQVLSWISTKCDIKHTIEYKPNFVWAEKRFSFIHNRFASLFIATNFYFYFNFTFRFSVEFVHQFRFSLTLIAISVKEILERWKHQSPADVCTLPQSVFLKRTFTRRWWVSINPSLDLEKNGN